MTEKLLAGDEGDNIIILDEQDTIVYDTEPSHIAKEFYDIYPQINMSLINEKKTDVTESDKSYIVSLVNHKINWKYVKLISKDELINKTNQVALPILWVSLICFVAFLGVSIIVLRNITKPIKVLKQSMKKVQEGDFNEKAEIINKDEIGSLAKNFNIMIEKIQELISKVYETQLKKVDSEFRALQAQINPHFLYNTLESINCLALLSDADDVSEMIQGLGRMFRYSIKQEKKDLVTLEDELNHVKDYILLQAVRYDDKFEIQYHVEPELVHTKVIKFILQPIVENAIYHGMEVYDEKKGIIYIEAKAMDKDLEIKVLNNGKEISDDKLTDIQRQLESDIHDLSRFDGKGKSIGIYNIHLRLQLQYGDKYGLSMHKKKDDMTEVRLLLPLDIEEDYNV